MGKPLPCLAAIVTLKLMIRPFHLRDLPLVHRLSGRGTSLHTETALIHHLHPVRGALLSLFTGGHSPTFVWRAEESDAAGFIQLSVADEGQRGHILYLGATAAPVGDNGDSSPPALDENVWLPLLDQAVVKLGRRGVHSLVAEVNETGPVLPMLRRAGFAVYTRQDIWSLSHDAFDAPSIPPDMLQPRRSVDDWDIQLLYANLVPRLVQLVEPGPPLKRGDSWVLREEGELTAYVHIVEGKVATWLRLVVHPNVDTHAEQIVRAALQLQPPRPSHPVFCNVPRYQSWLQTALQGVGFTLWGSQAVMVKHTVQHLPRPLPELAAVLESQGISASSPIVQRYLGPNGSRDKRR